MSYALSYNGLTIDSNSVNFIVDYQDGVMGLPIRISQNNLTGSDGAAVYKTLYGARAMVFEGTVRGTDIDDYFAARRTLLAAFSRDGLEHELSITTWDGQVFTIDAVVTMTPQLQDRSQNITTNRFRIELLAPDPYFRTGNSQSFTATVSSGNVGFPLAGPLRMPLGNNPAGSTIVINNTGDGVVIPQFRLDGQINTPVVTNVTTGQSFTINTNIIVDRYVTLYRENGDDFVLLDGVTSYYEYFSGDVFPIVPGNNTIRLTATTAGVNALLTINYQDVRRGI